ncbi:unnamed protein product [Parnassius apollo]|uniref:(apollo) hypothetical protein n=1 Tax=Parnassius apollo TaxID=110799 RepID=A0A8S3W6C9_PARAO|nr:unnamed protein product [Parnassius apollo]
MTWFDGFKVCGKYLLVARLGFLRNDLCGKTVSVGSMQDFYLSHKHCFTFQKPLHDSEIEIQLSQLLCSSEEENLDDEAVDSFATSSYNVDFDKRLDEIQGISVEELHSLLVGESDLSLIQDETFLNSPVQQIFKPILPQVASTSQDAIAEVHAGPSHVISDVPMLLDQNPGETTSLVSVADVQADHSSPVPLLAEPDESSNAEPTSSFSRDKFIRFQNKSRDWSFATDDITWPIFEKKMQIKKLQ